MKYYSTQFLRLKFPSNKFSPLKFFYQNILTHSVTQAVGSSPSAAGAPSSRLGHSMWVSWWTKRSMVRFSGVSPVFPYHKFHSTISPHSSHSFRFISFDLSLWSCVRRGRPASLLFTDLQQRGIIASHPSTRPCVGYELRIYAITIAVLWSSDLNSHQRKSRLLKFFIQIF